jgi:putative SOS response-associated peptidase YedK
MCGRFTLTTPTKDVAAKFEVPDPPLLRVRYNVTPSQVIAVVGLKPDGKRRGIAMLNWGLVPSWANDPKEGPRPVNLRAETVRHKFRDQFKAKRCLIPADGFYEWRAEGRKKLPQRFTLASGEPFGFAGLWDVWKGGDKPLLTCCLLTTTANELVAGVHDRMPVIVPPEDYARWLDPETPVDELEALLRPHPAERMQVTAANPVLNSPNYDGPECLEAA